MTPEDLEKYLKLMNQYNILSLKVNDIEVIREHSRPEQPKPIASTVDMTDAILNNNY